MKLMIFRRMQRIEETVERIEKKLERTEEKFDLVMKLLKETELDDNGVEEFELN